MSIALVSRRLGHIGLAALAWTLWGCSLARPLFVQDLALELPALPTGWEGLDLEGYELAWEDEAGLSRTAEVGVGESPVLSLSRGKAQAIFAWPKVRGMSLRPAGLLYPRECQAPDAEDLLGAASASFSYASGYAAEVWIGLATLGLDPAAYPLEKLEGAWAPKGRDPWALPPLEAASYLASGAFRATRFPASLVLVQLPPGPWYPESPFCTLSSGDVVRLSEGCHRFYAAGKVLEVLVEGEVASFLERVVSGGV